MKRQVLKADVDKFGKIVGGENGFKKTVYGRILYVDHFGAVALVDNDDIVHLFRRQLIDSFDEEEFVNKNA